MKGLNVFLKEQEEQRLDEIYSFVDEQLTKIESEEVNEAFSPEVNIMVYSIILIISGVAGLAASNPYGKGFSGWWQEKVMPKIQKIVGTDKKAKEIIQRIRNNPAAIEDIRNSPKHEMYDTIRKHLSKEDLEYLWDATEDNFKTGELNKWQMFKRKLSGKRKPY